MTSRLDELLAAAAVEHLGEDAGLGSITAWVTLHKAAPDLLAALTEVHEQAVHCWVNHYGENPEGGPTPRHIINSRAAIAKATAT